MQASKRQNKTKGDVWVTRVREYDPAKGRVVKRELSARTKGELERLYLDVKRREQRRKLGLPPEEKAPDPLTFGALADRFLAVRNVDERTKKGDQQRLTYARKTFGSRRVLEITPEEVEEWNAGLKLSATTRGHALKAMRQALEAGVRWGYLSKNPAAMKPPKADTRKPKPFTSWAEVFAVAEKAGDYGPLILTAVATGLRPQEWRALRRMDVDLAARELHVRQTVRNEKIVPTAKTDGSLRTVNLQRIASDALRAALHAPLAAVGDPNPAQPQPTDLVFASPRGGTISSTNFIRRVWRAALEAAKVEYRSPHQMRHSFACLALDAGVTMEEIAAQMGHTSTQITYKHYAEFRKPAHDRLVGALDAYAAKELAEMDGKRTESEKADAAV